MLSNFIKNKEKKENEDSVRNKKINLRPLDHILNIRDEDSVTNKSKIKIKSLERKNLTKENEIDNELSNLWNTLGVTSDFKKKFQFRLTYFGEEYQKIIIEVEKQKMKKIYNLIRKITNDIINKDKNIVNLKRLNVIIQNEIDNLEDDKHIIEAKKELIILKENLLNIYQQINELRKLITFDLINNKFDLSLMISSYILEPNFLLKLNKDLRIIKDGIIGTIFGIKGLFDPLLMEFSEEKNSQKSYDAYYTLFNELIYNNFNLGNKKKLNKLIIKKSEKNKIDINNIKLHYSFRKNNFINSKDEIEIPKNFDDKIHFFTQEVIQLENIYKDYFQFIPKNQKIIFNIKDNIYEYSNKITPMFIIKKVKGNLCLFCSLNYSSEEDNTLQISSFSTNNNDIDEMKNNILEIIKLINTHKIICQYITIDLYNKKKDGKFILDKDISNVFKQLNFKWAKLENLYEGIRFQKMRYINNNSIDNSITISAFTLSCGLIIYYGYDKIEKIKKSKDFNFNINNLNINILEKLKDKSEEQLKKISIYLKNIHYNEISDLNELKGILQSKNIKINLENNLSNKILYVIFHINPQFNSFFPIEINKKKYIRIKSKIDVLIDKETNQKFYMIIMKDGNGLIIAEPNDKFNKILQNKQINIYNIFSSIYHRVESVKEEVSSIYIPEINCESLSKNNTIQNSSIENISYVCDFFKLSSNELLNNKNIISLLPKENDIVIKEHFFLSIVNVEIAKELDIPSVFNCII